MRGSITQHLTDLTAGTHRPPSGVRIPVPPDLSTWRKLDLQLILLTRQGTLMYLMTVNLIKSAASRILLMELISR